MLIEHFKIALRHIGGNRLYAAINIVGLAIGLTCCLLILLFVRHELGYERAFANADRIYRISREYLPLDGARARRPASANAPVGPALLQDFPAIEAVARLWGGSIELGRDELSFVEPGARFADPALFTIFDFDWLAGTPATALAAPDGIVLTETLARRYFGRLDVLGETLHAMDRFELRVTGVIADLPAATHLDFSALMALPALPQVMGPAFLEQWNNNTDFHTYFLLREGADVAAVAAGMPAFLDRHAGEGASATSALPIMQIADIHLDSRMDEEWKAPGDADTIRSFALIAFGILLIACFNFMSIGTARSAQRAKEVGMRLSLGASRRNLVAQFLAESALTALLALLLAIVLAELLLPAFRAFTGIALAFDLAINADLLLGLLGLAAFVALFAGSYPAFYLAAYEPGRVLKGDLARGSGGLRVRNTLVVLQFAIAIALIVCTVVIQQQRGFAENLELGFDKDQIVVLPSASTLGYGADWPLLRDMLLEHGAIENVSISHYLPFAFNDNQFPLRRRGSTAETRIQYMLVDFGFFETYGIDLVAGRYFEPGQASDQVQFPSGGDPSARISFVLNEAAAAALGIDKEDFAGAVVEFAQAPIAGQVVGIVADTRFESARRDARPLAFILAPPGTAGSTQLMTRASVRIRADAVESALAHIDATWARLYPGDANNRYFLDNDFQAMYRADRRHGQLFLQFSAIAIAIACFGLFGLAAFNAERRTKEIGVRKVMGGSVMGIVWLLTNDFSRLVLLSNLIAWPIAYVAMDRWLQNFAYRIDLSPLVFVGSGAIALCIAWVTVGGIAARAASRKPVLALRYE